MAYYRGDYYRGRAAGDYYRGRGAGDPFWGALWTGIKTVGGALLGTLKAGTAAQSAQTTTGVSGVMAAQQLQGGLLGTMQPPPGSMIRTARQENQAIGAAFRGQRGMLRPGEQIVVINGKRYRQDFEGFLHRIGRHMNPANPKALRRSIRRVVGFGRLASRSKRAIGKAATALGVHRSSSRRFPPRRRAS